MARQEIVEKFSDAALDDLREFGRAGPFGKELGSQVLEHLHSVGFKGAILQEIKTGIFADGYHFRIVLP